MALGGVTSTVEHRGQWRKRQGRDALMPLETLPLFLLFKDFDYLLSALAKGEG